MGGKTGVNLAKRKYGYEWILLGRLRGNIEVQALHKVTLGPMGFNKIQTFCTAYGKK